MLLLHAVDIKLRWLLWSQACQSRKVDWCKSPQNSVLFFLSYLFCTQLTLEGWKVCCTLWSRLKCFIFRDNNSVKMYKFVLKCDLKPVKDSDKLGELKAWLKRICVGIDVCLTWRSALSVLICVSVSVCIHVRVYCVSSAGLWNPARSYWIGPLHRRGSVWRCPPGSLHQPGML